MHIDKGRALGCTILALQYAKEGSDMTVDEAIRRQDIVVEALDAVLMDVIVLSQKAMRDHQDMWELTFVAQQVHETIETMRDSSLDGVHEVCAHAEKRLRGLQLFRDVPLDQRIPFSSSGHAA